MDISFLIKGFIIGFSIASLPPVGPISVLCIRRTLAEGRAVGLLTGLGTATADAIYGCIAGFGLTIISSLLLQQELYLRLIGGIFLCYIGFKTFQARPNPITVSTASYNLTGAYASALFLTLTNPGTIFYFAAVFVGLGLVRADGNYAAVSLLTLGVFTGSALWWLVLSGGVSLFRAKFTPDRMRWVNKIAGGIIIGFGLLVLLSLL